LFIIHHHQISKVMRQYLYQPRPYGIDRTWTSATEVYQYLIAHESERARIRTEVERLDPGQPFTILIIHHCLPGYLKLSTVDSDYAFLLNIERFLSAEQRGWPVVDSSTPLPPSLLHNLQATTSHFPNQVLDRGRSF
jgi:hypothetical protein